MASVTRFGADIGGTFTDVAAVDASGSLRVGKRLTTHGAEDAAVVAAIADTGISLAANETIIAHGHTLVINSLLERKGARVGLVTTAGFGDVLEIGRGSRPESFNFRYERDPPLVPAELRFEIPERTDSAGQIMREPTTTELDALVDELRSAGVEAVAVAFLNSYVNPDTELHVADYLRTAMPGVIVSRSSELSRQWREYERFSTAAANAYVAPVAERYLERLVGGLGETGFAGEFVVLDSSGGALTLDLSRRLPVMTVESGPVAGAVGARAIAERLAIDKMVTFDMGGTTAKSCLIEDGRFALTNVYWIGGYERGFPLQVGSLDVTEVGAGGGSLAWTDVSGRLRVGPRSAGSTPGPACYGLGGTEPTVTDANLYCGRIDPEHFVGSLTLTPEAATSAIERLASQVAMEPRRLALGILKLANIAMAVAVRRQTLERGRDPREFTAMAYGGAGPMHACEVAAEVGIATVVVPPFPGHFSAIGMLGVDLRVERRVTFRGLLAQIDPATLSEALNRLADDLAQELISADGEDVERLYSYSLALRYHGQDHTLMIPAPTEGLEVPSDDNLFRNAFEDEYLRRYGHLDPQGEIEVVEIEVVGQRRLGQIESPQADFATGESNLITSYFALDAGAVTTQVVPRASLARGDTFAGPMIIYEEGATTVVPTAATGRVGDERELVIDVSALHGG